jgi:hypothetical protein
MNGDDEVNRADVALFAQFFGTESGATWSTGDFDDDGRTTLADLALLQANLGSRLAESPVAAAAAALPEPGGGAAIAGCLLTLMLIAARRTRHAVGAGRPRAGDWRCKKMGVSRLIPGGCSPPCITSILPGR